MAKAGARGTGGQRRGSGGQPCGEVEGEASRPEVKDGRVNGRERGQAENSGAIHSRGGGRQERGSLDIKIEGERSGINLDLRKCSPSFPLVDASCAGTWCQRRGKLRRAHQQNF